MDTLRYVGKDEPLTTEQGQYIKDRAVFAARRTFMGRKLFGTSLRKIDSGSQTFCYDTQTEVANAAIDFNWPGRENQDIVNLARTTVGIPNLHKEFEINKLDLASSRTIGTTLNTSTAESAVYKVGLLEDTLLILGYAADGTNYDINGLYNAAGNSEATSLDWGTAANIVTSVNNTIALLLADNILPPYNLTINPTQAVQAEVLIGTTAVSYTDWIEKRLRDGTIYITPGITAGIGMMTKVEPSGMFEYVLAEDLTTETEVLDIQHGNNLFGRVYVRGLPVVYDANAISQMTTI